MSSPDKRNPAGGRGSEGTFAGGGKFHAQFVTAEPLLQRLDGVQKSGQSWRARCPACGGTSRKVIVTQTDDRVLVHCFGGCKAEDVIGAVGLTWADLFPPRMKPQTREERDRARRAMREAGWASALQVLAKEAAIIRIAAAQLLKDEPIEWEDYCRLVKAEERVAEALGVFVSPFGAGIYR